MDKKLTDSWTQEMLISKTNLLSFSYLAEKKNGRNTDLFGNRVVNGFTSNFLLDGYLPVGREFLKIHLFILFYLFILLVT